MCASSGLRAGCVSGVLVNRHAAEIPDEATVAAVEARAIGAVVAAGRALLGAS